MEESKSALDVFDEKFAEIRIDEETKMGSVIDVVVVVTGKNSGNASNVVKTLSEELTQKMSQLRINGKGRETPVADAKTLIQIVWELPGKAAKAFRRDCANYICRVLGGDQTLVDEMELRAKHTPDVQREFFMQNVVVPDVARLKEEERYQLSKRRAETDLRRDEAEIRETEERVKKMRIENTKLEKEYYEDLFKMIPENEMDERDRINIRDFRRRYLDQELRARETTVLAIAPATPVAPRRLEISIPQTARKCGLKYGNGVSGTIGKLMKKLYVARHGKEPATRRVSYQGKPIDELAYWDDDEDLMILAITRYATSASDEERIGAIKKIDELLS